MGTRTKPCELAVAYEFGNLLNVFHCSGRHLPTHLLYDHSRKRYLRNSSAETSTSAAVVMCAPRDPL